MKEESAPVCRIAFPFLHPPIDHKRPEREKSGNKDLRRATDGPLGVRFRARERDAKCDEQDAMNRAGDFHRDGHVPDIFQRHGDADQHKK